MHTSFVRVFFVTFDKDKAAATLPLRVKWSSVLLHRIYTRRNGSLMSVVEKHASRQKYENCLQTKTCLTQYA